MDIFESSSYSDTENIARRFAEKLNPGDIVRLQGEMGVGKTVFVRGIASYFEAENDVCSPTFAIMNIYPGTTPIYHFDLYRLESEEDIYDAGLYEFMAKGDGISVVEWPDLLREYPKAVIYDITITKNLDISENYRKITMEESL
jgi:tRNA threonylcarbamoyladenosine biosynthesis protein TsaE